MEERFTIQEYSNNECGVFDKKSSKFVYINRNKNLVEMMLNRYKNMEKNTSKIKFTK